jgi:hypothetical protein
VAQLPQAAKHTIQDAPALHLPLAYGSKQVKPCKCQAIEEKTFSILVGIPRELEENGR